MRSTNLIRKLCAGALCAGAALSLVAPADAAPGRNGRIVFTSGREAPNDNEARIYMLGPVALPGQPLAVTPPLGGQARHPSWSPDRTKVVFAIGPFTGDPKTEEYDLWVKDFVADTLSPLNATQHGDGLSSDHPAWSPDGSRIAFETQTVDNDANREIVVQSFGSLKPPTPITASPQTELKPAWSADSTRLYFARQNGVAPKSNYDIYEAPADGSAAATAAIYDPDFDEYQPAISADGKQLCYTRQSKLGDHTTADIWITPLVGSGPTIEVSQDPAKGDINCVWSPEGDKIAYTNGVFNQGRLAMVNADGSSLSPQILTDDMGSNNFDGNADWAADGSPECPDVTVTTRPDTPVTLPLECTDTGPAYERTDPNGTATSVPQNGTLSDDSPLTNPSTVRYTPNAGFTGTDTVTYNAFDDYGFGDDGGTVTIRVEAPPVAGGGNDGGTGGNGGTSGDGGTGGTGGDGGVGTAKPKCAGLTATIVGTARRDRLVGTRRRDVIVAGRGNDVVRAGRGNDVVCGGPGRDRLSGGRGRDRLAGGAGRDRCTGGPGRDRAVRCETRIRIP